MARAPAPPPPCALVLLLSSVSMASAVTVMGWVGQPVTLPCQYSVRRPSDVNPVCWGRGGCPMSQCSDPLIQTDQTRVTWRKHNRYQLRGALNRGDVSLTIVDANEEDSGTYCCRIDVPGWFNDIKNNIQLQMRRLPTTTTTTTTTTSTTTTTTTPVPTTTTITTETTTTASTSTATTTTELTTMGTPTTSVPTTKEEETTSTMITTCATTADEITPPTFTTMITNTVPPTPVITTISHTTLIAVPATTPTPFLAMSQATEPITTSITTLEATAANTLSPTSTNTSTYQMINEMKFTPTDISATISKLKVTSTIIDSQTVTELMTASTSEPTSATADINGPSTNNITQPISMKVPTSATLTYMSSNNAQTTTALSMDSTSAPTTGHDMTMSVHTIVLHATSTGPAFNFTKISEQATSSITTTGMTPRNITIPEITDIKELNATRTPDSNHTTRIINFTEPLLPTETTGELFSDITKIATTSTERSDIWTMEPADITLEYTTESPISKLNQSTVGEQMPIKSTHLLSSSSLIAVVCGSVALFVLILLFGLKVRSKIWNKYHLDKTERFWADGRPAELFNSTLQDRDGTENIFTL